MKEKQESDYPHTSDNREWWQCQPGTKWFYIPGYAEHGKALRCDYPSQPHEDAEMYWNRIREEIIVRYSSTQERKEDE